MEGLWVTAAADAQAGRQNWVQDAYNLTTVKSPTFTADRGYQGNGTTSYLWTGTIDPSVPVEVVRIESTECDKCEADDGGFGSETWFDAAGEEVAQD